MTVLSAETAKEREVARQLRAIAIAEIEARGTDEVAKILGLTSSGVEALRWRSEWPLTTAFRAVEALKIDLVDHWHKELTEAGSNESHAPRA